jgi:tryptophan-rich sensory protein
LWFAIVSNIIVFYRIKREAGLLLVPYLLWVSFATFLNFYILILN